MGAAESNTWKKGVMMRNSANRNILLDIFDPVTIYATKKYNQRKHLWWSLSRAILHGKISESGVVCALTGSFYNIVNHLFTGIFCKFIKHSNINITIYKT